MNYPIHERFIAFQGEGFHMGKKAFFIRLWGCPIHCPWCDSAGTWHPNWKPAHITSLSAEFLTQEAAVWTSPLVIITGGEPAVYDLRPLTDALHQARLPAHLETSGHFILRGDFDWITLSPKKWGPPLPECVQQADEFKIIVEEKEDIPLYLTMLEERGRPSDAPIWLHPEWSHRHDPAVLSEICTAVVTSEQEVRAGYQIHKLYDVDLKDSRSQGKAPLGGEPSRGY
jgi:7-carboxy-7-deazaguanine synthase